MLIVSPRDILDKAIAPVAPGVVFIKQVVFVFVSWIRTECEDVPLAAIFSGPIR